MQMDRRITLLIFGKGAESCGNMQRIILYIRGEGFQCARCVSCLFELQDSLVQELQLIHSGRDLLGCDTMKMEAALSSETLISCHITTRWHNLENLNFKRCYWLQVTLVKVRK